jgi:hypothetical protein
MMWRPSLGSKHVENQCYDLLFVSIRRDCYQDATHNARVDVVSSNPGGRMVFYEVKTFLTHFLGGLRPSGN